MPRTRNSCTSLQSTIDFPARKTRSKGKTEPKFAAGLASPRKRSERTSVTKTTVSPKKKKNNKGHAEDVFSDNENQVQSDPKLKKTASSVQSTPLRTTATTKPLKSPVQKTPYTPSSQKFNWFDGNATPCTPKSRSVLSLGKAQGLCYSAVKKALHTGAPRSILCREKEQETIKTFLQNNITKKHPASLYISGAPGTGKTACLTKVMKELEDIMEDCPTTFINCMTLQHSHAIFAKIIEDFKFKEKVCPKDSQKFLEKKFTSSGPMRVLILDELDQLETKNQDVLYTMFEWPSLSKSKVILIGIANALDLTDRLLPRLQARPRCKPELLHFSPYTRNQIATILQDRVSQSQENDVILDPSAIQFCARKVAAVAGDMRKALDICRRAVEVVEADVRKQHILQPVSDRMNSPQSISSPAPTPKKVGLSHIANVVSDVYGSKIMSGSSKGGQPTIPLQQKLLMCTLMLSMKQGKSKEVTIGKLHDLYSNVCKKQQITEVTQDDFIGLCKMLEARGIVGLKKAKEARLMKVSLKIDEKEVEYALQDKTLLSTILQTNNA